MEKLKKEFLKAPDRIARVASSSLEWMLSQIVLLLVVLFLVLAAVVGGTYYVQVQRKTEARAQFHYSKARSHFEQATLAPQAATKSPSSDDQAKAWTNFDQEIQILERDYAGSTAQLLSAGLKAERAQLAGDLEKAVKDYEVYVRAFRRESRVLGQYPLAVSYESAKKYDQALKVYDEIIQANLFSAFTVKALLGKARVLTMLGRKPEAKAAYERILKDFSDAPETAQVRVWLAELDA